MLFAAAPDYTNFAPAYKCGTAAAPTICYGTDGGKTDGLFRNLQAKVNYFAPLAGFAPVGVDSFIGPATVAALQKIAATLMNTASTSSTGIALAPLVGSKETIAQTSVTIMGFLEKAISILQLPPVAPPTAPSTTPATTRPPELPAPPPPTSGSHKKLWIGLGVLALAGGTAWYFMRK